MSNLSLLTTQLILPLLFILWLWGRRHSSRTHWVLQVLATTSVVSFSLVVGAQAWTSIYIGSLWLILLIVAFLKSFFRLSENWKAFKLGEGWEEKIFTVTNILICIIFLPLNIYAFTGYFSVSESVDLGFPLRNGVYIVGHGGSNPLINYHNTNNRQRYALDISKINAYGTRAKGLYPKQLKSYAVYGDTVYSPCKGKIQKTVSNLADYTPPKRNKEHPAGNHVIIKCDEVRIFLAHLMQRSIVVDSGNVINQDVPIGRVGNSGNTSEPHLHIHAVQNEKGIPITFNGRFLVRNSLIWR
ncbi:Peptidase family M23 [Fodinibius salinus]|uniref:Peptidase family M23 n=1 Tax=Fodinibius salinus TaxID=860790 RepID=A0A5D3YN98_9BACT|nr:peptidoglycan DD-metalloendopeptidase family protein [Fodinibius salinus]TYP95344.1 Peptidase family M23 [Fodinibius salinus]